MDIIRNENIRGSMHVRCFGEKVREEKLRLFRHVQRGDSEYIDRGMMRLELRDRRPRGRPKRRLKDGMKEDIFCGNP